jgi:hypothetical protein
VTIEEHATEFAGQPVRDYDPDEGIVDPSGFAYRLTVDYDASESGETMTGLLARFIEDPAASQVRALIIGAWENVFDPNANSERIVEALVTSSPSLASLRALFLGDVTREESEISWIQQSDVTALFDAYPNLEHFRVRGGSGLVIGSLRHKNLRSLAVETGGLDAAAVRGIGTSDLPALEHLELWIGEDGYGRTTTVADLAPILQGDVLPALRYLGLRNCELANQVAEALTQAPILSRIKVLDLSLGNLDDAGAQALAACPGVARLEKLDIHHHYASPAAVAALEALGIAVDASGPQEPHHYGDEEYRYIAVAE